jgi:RimJ/RimL family protein N-acetyltransferase
MGTILRFTPIYQAGIDDITAVISAWPVAQFMDLPQAGDIAEIARWAASSAKGASSMHLAYMGTELCGITGLSAINIRHSYAWASAGLLPGYTGRGLGKSLCQYFEHIGFAVLGLRRIELQVRHDNSRALRSFHKYGYLEEGRLRQNFASGNIFYDSIVMSKLNIV